MIMQSAGCPNNYVSISCISAINLRICIWENLLPPPLLPIWHVNGRLRSNGKSGDGMAAAGRFVPQRTFCSFSACPDDMAAKMFSVAFFVAREAMDLC